MKVMTFLRRRRVMAKMNIAFFMENKILNIFLRVIFSIKTNIFRKNREKSFLEAMTTSEGKEASYIHDHQIMGVRWPRTVKWKLCKTASEVIKFHEKKNSRGHFPLKINKFKKFKNLGEPFILACGKCRGKPI